MMKNDDEVKATKKKIDIRLILERDLIDTDIKQRLVGYQ